VVYHAANVFSGHEAKDFNAFVKLLEDERVKKMWGIEKQQLQHLSKAPVLAVELPPQFWIPVKRLFGKVSASTAMLNALKDYRRSLKLPPLPSPSVNFYQSIR